MRKLFSSTNIRGLLAWMIKLGTLGFNLPATMGVAQAIVTLVTGTTDPLLVLILQVSGVVVVDTVFLAAWYELDTNKVQDDSDKLADALTVVAMYIITVVIGIVHREGLAGFLFRVPMGIAVARSTWKTISYSIRRTSENNEKAPMPLAVRWEQMKAITTKGIASIRSDLYNFLQDLKAVDIVRAEHRRTKQEVGVEVADYMRPLYKEQEIATTKLNSINMQSLPSLNSGVSTALVDSNSEVSTNGSNGNSKKNYSIHTEGNEWIATCLYPGCSVVIRNGSHDTVRRKIVGHGNKHKKSEPTIIVESVVDGEVAAEDSKSN